jgi:type I restriction enzyme S subunit
MTPEEFLNNFGLLVEAPEGMKRLRATIIDLAVSGKLSPSKAIPAGSKELLIRLREAHQAQVLEGRLQRTAFSPIQEKDQPFPTPAHWTWVRLGELAIKLGAGSTPLGGRSVYKTEGIKFIRSQNVWNDGLHLDDVAFISTEIHQRMGGTSVLPEDILLNITGASIGRSAIVPKDFDTANVSQHVAIVRLALKELCDFVHLFIISSHFQREIDNVQVGISREGLSMSRLQNFAIPLPPIKEQKQIISQVRSLLALCDELDARQTKQRETGTRFTQSALDALTSADGPEEFARAWQRVAGNFDVLLATPKCIGKIRQAILELAVRGRLVRQEPSDGLATEVLQLVSERRLRLQAEKKASRLDSVPDVSAASVPYAPPSGWLWTRLANVSICRDGQRIPVSKAERQHRQGVYDYYGASGVIDTINDFIFDEPLLLVGEDGANLLNRSTPIAFIATGKYWVNNHAHVLDGASLDSLRYLAIFINALDLAPYVTGTAQPKMNQAKMNSIPVAVPPLPEQKRIVAKVDQLMALCDTLESKLRDAEQGAQLLAEAMAAEMVA